MAVTTYILENSYTSQETEDFAASLCNIIEEAEEFEVYNTNPRTWNQRNEQIFISFISQPTVKNLVIESAFAHTMHVEDDTTQLEYFLELIETVCWCRRELHLTPLSIYINYQGYDFMTALDRDSFGDGLKNSLKNFIERYENVTVKMYKDWQFIDTLNNLLNK